MSNFMAIATVTATLRRVLLDHLNAAAAEEPGAVPNAAVTSVRPDTTGSGLPEIGINVFLYHVSANAAYRNADLPTRRADGSLVQRPQAALDLHYLLSFYGHENELMPQRLLGLAVRRLHAHPLLTRQMIRDTLADPLFSFLAASDLADQVELVRFTPVDLSLEELSKLWSVFFQTSYALSIAYRAGVVLIETEAPVRSALPVRRPNIYAVPFRQPLIAEVAPEAGRPILADSTLLISGERLRGEATAVRIAGEVVAPQGPVTDTRLRVPLGSVPGLRAGVQGVQVVHTLMLGTPPAPHRGVESNVAAFVLCPAIQRDPDTGDYRIATASVSGAGPYSADVTLELAPAIGRSQRVELWLNQIDPPSEHPAAYRFRAPARDIEAAPEASESITIPIRGVQQGMYLVRVQVDGAESPLDDSGGPRLEIP